MKLLFKIAALLCLVMPAFGQGVRYDNRVLTVAGNVPPFAQVPVLAIPAAMVTVCNDGACASQATIYSNQALTVPTGNPIKADGQGRFGFWAASGTYFYQVVTPSGNVLGIFPITLGGSGSGGNVISVNGHAGIVILAAADVGADPVGSAATAQANAITSAASTALQKAGGTMTGPIVLPGDPTTNLQASTKQYVDAHAGGATIAHTTAVIKGDGAGNGVAGTPGTDYLTPSAGTAANSTQVGGVALSGLCQTGGTGCPASGSGNTTSTALTTNRVPKSNGANSIVDSKLTDDGTTLTYGGTGPGCLSLATNNICITAPPYNASVSGATTTTTSATFGVGTSGSVASCSTFLPGNGVLITGAGTSGANYIGTVVTCTGTTLTVTPTTATSVASTTIVQHDETAAFLAAIAAIAAIPSLTGTIWAPDGLYLINGPLLDTSGANAIIPVPKVPNYAGGLVDISIKGFTLPDWESGTAGFIITTAATTGNLFGGFDSATGGGFPPFTNVKLSMENITINGPTNTGVVFVNATSILAFQGHHLLIGGGGSGVPSNTTGGGIYMPAIGNEVQNILDDVNIARIYTPYKLTEHTHARSIYAAFGHDCFVFDNGNTTASVSDYLGNGTQVDYLWEQNCVNDIVGGTGPFHSPVNISLADLENTTGHGVLDASNVLYGIINIEIPSSVGGTMTYCNANVSGAVHTTIHYINCQPEAGAGGGAGVPSGLIEIWGSQEGAGSTLVNTGLDFTNKMTTTSVTWSTAAGFTGNVAHYNGSTSISTATSATNTSFDGTTPFSACIWTTPTTFTGIGNQYPIANANGTPTGWLMQIEGATISAGAADVEIYHDGSHFIQVHTAAGAVTAGVINHVCMTYAATSLASGVTIYVNGVAQALTTVSDTLSGTITSTAPQTLGSLYNGAIGEALIFNRLLSASDVLAIFTHGPKPY